MIEHALVQFLVNPVRGEEDGEDEKEEEEEEEGEEEEKEEDEKDGGEGDGGDDDDSDVNACADLCSGSLLEAS